MGLTFFAKTKKAFGYGCVPMIELPKGYDLALMLLKDKKLENNVLYLGFHDDVLHYKCIDPDGKYQENTIAWQELHENGAANELKPENGQLLQEFEAIKTAILKATSKRGHTPAHSQWHDADYWRVTQ